MARRLPERTGEREREQRVGDVLFWGGTVMTGVAGGPRADALAVRDGRVLAVGDRARDAVGPGTEAVDLEGGCLVPAFRDGHAHPLHAGLETVGPPLKGAGSLAELTARVGSYARDHPELPVVVGKGYDPTLAPGGLFDAADLDAVVPDRPVVLISSDGHMTWVNSLALARAGVVAETPDPPLGVVARREDGSPLGTLLESARELVAEVVPPTGLALRRTALSHALETMAAAGIVWTLDAWCLEDEVQAWLGLAEAGPLPLRADLALLARPDRWREDRAWFAEARREVERRGGGQVTARTVKFFADGVIEGGTGALLEPYADAPHSHGLPNWEAGELAEAVAAVDADGFAPHLHAIGDAAVRAALDAVEHATAVNGPRDRRAATAHTQLVDPADLPRFAQLGVIANFEPLWAHRDPVMIELTEPRLGPERSARQYPMASLLRSGAPVSFGSDWPVTSHVPLEGVAVAVTRQDPDGRPPGGWTPEERLTLDEALTAYSAGTAYQAFEDPATGTLAPGARADVCLLEADPASVEPLAIAGLRVLGTWLGGREVHRHG